MEGLQIKRERSVSQESPDIINIKRREKPGDVVATHIKVRDWLYRSYEEEDDEVGDSKDEVLKDPDPVELDDEKTRDKCGRTEHGKQKRESRVVSHGCHLVEGKMRHGTEDYAIAEQRKVDGHELGLYAIFDGHSGRNVAKYLGSHLFDKILDEPDFLTDHEAAVKRAFKVTDNYILEHVVGSRGGSTAVTAILIDRKKLIIANVGDCRAVLCKNGKADPITVDHDPLREKEMVESRGGFVSKKLGNVPRVDGQLAMTRAFGDERLKGHITAEPDVRVLKVDEDTESVILASDGLWKVMSNQEAVDCIHDLEDGQEAAEELIREALLRESQDDISCVTIMFHH